MPPPSILRVAASTSNLGPGFDALGLALALHLEVRLRAGERAGVRVRALPVDGQGDAGRAAAADWPRGADDLLVRALELALGRLGGEPRSLELEVRSEIPIGRGLGSSGAAVAAGLLLGASLAPRAPEPGELLRWGLELEGHPDNVAASLSGGCTLCVPGDPPALLRPPVHPGLAFAVAWPEARVSTAEARAVLPAEVPLADAVENARRLALLLEGLRTGDPELLRRGGEDRLHVRHRLPLIPGGAAALDAARAAGAWLATISGSGSALLAIAAPADAAAAAAAMVDVFRAETGAGTGRVVAIASEPPAVRPG